MTIVTLEDGSFVDLEDVENLQNQNQLDTVNPIPQTDDNLTEYNRPCDRIHVYDYYELDDSIDDAPPAYCRVEESPPSYVESDLVCTPQERRTSSHSSLQAHPLKSTQQDYHPFVNFQMPSFEAYNPGLKRKRSRRVGPSCLRCWMLRQKCIGDLPCDRCAATDRSIALKFQPCITSSLSTFDFSIFYPHLQTGLLERLYLPTTQHDSIAKDVAFSKLLHYKAMIIRLMILSFGIAESLRIKSKSSLFIEFPVSPAIVQQFSQLQLLQEFIVEMIKLPSSASDSALISMLTFVMLEARAIIFHNLLKALENLMKHKLRSAPSDAPDLFCAFLFLVSTQIDMIGKQYELFTYSNPEMTLQAVGFPPNLSSLTNHLCRWMEFFSFQILERRGHIDIHTNGRPLELRTGRAVYIGGFEQPTRDCHQSFQKLTTPHELQGAEPIDIWTGNVIDSDIQLKEEVRHTAREVAEEIDSILVNFRGLVELEGQLQLDRVKLHSDGSYYDFVSQSFHPSQAKVDEEGNSLLKLCESELLTLPGFIAILSLLFKVS